MTSKKQNITQSLISGGSFIGSNFSKGSFSNNNLKQVIGKEAKECPACELAVRECECIKKEGYCEYCQTEQADINKCSCQKEITKEPESLESSEDEQSAGNEKIVVEKQDKTITVEKKKTKGTNLIGKFKNKFKSSSDKKNRAVITPYQREETVQEAKEISQQHLEIENNYLLNQLNKVEELSQQAQVIQTDLPKID